MELRQESSRGGAATSTSRTLSWSSSAFVSASQSPFFSPRSPPSNESPSAVSESSKSEIPTASIASQPIPSFISTDYTHRPNTFSSLNNEIPSCSYGPQPSLSLVISSKLQDTKETRSLLSNNSSSSSNVPSKPSPYNARPNDGSASRKSTSAHKGTSGYNAASAGNRISFARTSASLSSSARVRGCDVYIGTHGQKPSLLRFTKWLRAELEMQGIACFAADRARYTDSRSHDIADRVINSATFGVVIITKKSFGNPYSIEELRIFLERKNLVPLFFDVGPGDCLARDIIEKRGELWEKQGGDLWMLYDGEEKEWKEAVEGLSRVADWKLEAFTGNWRNCILRAVSLLGTRLGRRSVAEREKMRKERLAGEEYPFPRNPNFVGRKKELLELEAILFGKVDADGDEEVADLKNRPKRRDCVIARRRNDGDRLKDAEEVGQTERSDGWKDAVGDKTESSKGKQLVMWKESEKETEIQRGRSYQRARDRRNRPRALHRERYAKRNRDLNLLYGRGIACVSGESGIGKTELVLEFAYKFSQRYRMVLWVGGEARYLRQNYLNLCLLLGLDVSTETQIGSEKCRNKTFEEQEMEVFQRVRKELIRDIPYLLVIDNLESERDWWDGRDVLELLPRFGGTTHVIISTRLPRVMNLEPLKLSYLSSVEATSLMKGRRDFSIPELDALRVIEERLGRLTLGLGLAGAILSELPITPSRLLDTVNRVPLRDLSWGIREDTTLKHHPFLIQLLDVLFCILDHTDETKKLAARMALVSAWFAPHPIPVSLLAFAANIVPETTRALHLWKKCMHAIGCCFLVSKTKRSEAEASAMLIKFGIARSSSKPGCIHIHEMLQLYARKKGGSSAARAMFLGVSSRGSISPHSEHIWAACFLVFRFGNDPVFVEPKVPELLFFIRRLVIPLAIHSFSSFSRCHAALELLRLCSSALEAAEESFVSEAQNLLAGSLCWRRPGRNDTKLNECLWQDVAFLKATLLEIRAKLMLRGGQYDAGEELCRTCISIRTVMFGPDHPDTIAAQETLAKLVRYRTNIGVG